MIGYIIKVGIGLVCLGHHRFYTLCLLNRQLCCRSLLLLHQLLFQGLYRLSA